MEKAHTGGVRRSDDSLAYYKSYHAVVVATCNLINEFDRLPWYKRVWFLVRNKFRLGTSIYMEGIGNEKY